MCWEHTEGHPVRGSLGKLRGEGDTKTPQTELGTWGGVRAGCGWEQRAEQDGVERTVVVEIGHRGRETRRTQGGGWCRSLTRVPGGQQWHLCDGGKEEWREMRHVASNHGPCGVGGRCSWRRRGGRGDFWAKMEPEGVTWSILDTQLVTEHRDDSRSSWERGGGEREKDPRQSPKEQGLQGLAEDKPEEGNVEVILRPGESLFICDFQAVRMAGTRVSNEVIIQYDTM